MSKSILIVEDEAVTAFEIEAQLQRWGYNIVGTPNSGEKALKMAEELHPDVVLMDIRLKGKIDGISAANKIIKEMGLLLIYITASSEDVTISKALKTNPYGYLIKPYDAKELKFTIEMALYKHQMEKKLKRSEELYRTLSESSPSVIILVDKELRGLYANKTALKMSGLEMDEFVGKTATELFPTKNSRMDMHVSNADLSNNSSEKSHNEHPIYFQGEEYFFDYNMVPIQPGEENECFLIIAHDITQRKKMELALKESEENYRNLYETMSQGVVYQDREGNIISANPAAEEILGLTQDQMKGRTSMDPNWRAIREDGSSFHGDTHPSMLALKTGKKVHNTVMGVFNLNKKSYTWINVNATPKFDSEETEPSSVYTTFEDITDRKLMEEDLKKSLKEKEILIKEIHHRVKNNLMVISSLLSLQSRYIKDKKAISAFKESQNRAQSMALIHESLYQSSDLKHINLGDYIRNLVNKLYNSYVVDENIQMNLDVDDLMVDINIVVPIGLIVNELVSNSLKHAFPQKSGTVNIHFNKKDGDYILIIADNGKGFSEEIDFQNTDSLGLQIVNTLTSQIQGNIKLNRDNGTEFVIRFKDEEI